MLGEGYDHRYLSVAAIFRPFKSLLAYEQFIGRILRFIPEGTNADDNIGDIVVHKYLNLDVLWENYKREIEESEIIKSLSDIEIAYDDPDGGNGSGSGEMSIDVGTVTERGSSILEEDVYLHTELIKKHKQDEAEKEQKIKDIMASLNIERDEAERIVRSIAVKNNPIKRPDLYFASRKKDIDLRIKEQIVPELLLEYNIDKEGMGLKDFSIFRSRDYSWIPDKAKNNGAMLAIYFTVYLKNTIGAKRQDWTIDDYDIADEKLSKCVEYVKLKLQELNLQ